MTEKKDGSLPTPEQKREKRIKKWLSATGIEFVSLEAKERYAIKANRIIKTINPIGFPARSLQVLSLPIMQAMI